MKVVIKKGQHKSNEWYRLFFGNKIERVYKFTKNSIYDLGDEDQKDWNKLFGFTSGILPKFKVFFNTDERIKYCDFKIRLGKWYWCVFMPYHWNSARFGCRYNTVTKEYEFDSYVYDNGFRRYDGSICSHFLDKEIVFTINKTKETYQFKVKGRYDDKEWRKSVIVNKTKSFGIILPAFFGGNEVAPNDVEYLVK